MTAGISHAEHKILCAGVIDSLGRELLTDRSRMTASCQVLFYPGNHPRGRDVMDSDDSRQRVGRIYGMNVESLKEGGPLSELTIRNPAPDGSPPQLPSGTCRAITITRDHKSGTT